MFKFQNILFKFLTLFFGFLSFLLVDDIYASTIKKEPPKASIVVNAKTGEVLYASNPDLRTQPASMTKMMTLRLLFKAIKEKRITLNTLISISKHAMIQEPCKIGFKEGERISVRNAIMALITRSANDVAVAVAERLGGSERRFVAMMNAEARRLKMWSTVFRNSSGWKDTTQLTTVRDMMKLARSLIYDYPDFFPLFSTKSFYYKGKIHKNHNKLLGSNGGIIVDGLKTGYVTASGYNIAVTAKKGGDRVVAVVVGGRTAKKRDALVQWLLALSFNKLATRQFLAKSEQQKNKKNTVRQKNVGSIIIAKNDIKGTLKTGTKINSNNYEISAKKDSGCAEKILNEEISKRKWCAETMLKAERSEQSQENKETAAFSRNIGSKIDL